MPAAAGYPTQRAEATLPELAAVPWRPRASAETLHRRGANWTLFTTLHVLPFVAVAATLVMLQPLSAPVALVALVHAWVLPELYAQRGANTVRPKRTRRSAGEPVAQGLLGDLLGHRERELQRETGLALERGELGVWLVGEAGAGVAPPCGRRPPRFLVAPPRKKLPPAGPGRPPPRGPRGPPGRSP